MALKRKNFSYNAEDDITHFMPTTGEAGGVVAYTSTTFTNNPDDPDNQVGYVATPVATTYPAGVLMQDVVNYDPTVTPRNEQKGPFETLQGSKVWVRTSGYVETDMVDPAVLASVVAGEDAYLAANGQLTNDNSAPSIRVGRFGSSADADGYVKFNINAK